MRIEDVKVGMKVVLGPQTTVKHLPEIFRGVYSRGQMYVYVVSVDDQRCYLATHLNGGGIGAPMHPGWIEPYIEPQQATKAEPNTVTYKRWATLRKDCFTKPLHITQYGLQMFVVTSAAMIPVTSLHKGLELIDNISPMGGKLLHGNEVSLVLGGQTAIVQLCKDAVFARHVKEWAGDL